MDEAIMTKAEVEAAMALTRYFCPHPKCSNLASFLDGGTCPSCGAELEGIGPRHLAHRLASTILALYGERDAERERSGRLLVGLTTLKERMERSIGCCCGKDAGKTFCETFGCGTLKGYLEVIGAALKSEQPDSPAKVVMPNERRPAELRSDTTAGGVIPGGAWSREKHIRQELAAMEADPTHNYGEEYQALARAYVDAKDMLHAAEQERDGLRASLNEILAGGWLETAHEDGCASMPEFCGAMDVCTCKLRGVCERAQAALAATDQASRAGESS